MFVVGNDFEQTRDSLECSAGAEEETVQPWHFRFHHKEIHSFSMISPLRYMDDAKGRIWGGFYIFQIIASGPFQPQPLTQPQRQNPRP